MRIRNILCLFAAFALINIFCQRAFCTDDVTMADIISMKNDLDDAMTTYQSYIAACSFKQIGT
jgi:hypothetical protein